MPTLSGIRTANTTLIRKGLEGAVFIAPYTATNIAALTDANGALVALPAGYVDAGWLEKGQGAAWAVDSDASDTASWGVAGPTRRDITSRVTGLSFTMQETKRASLEVYHGMSLAAVTPGAGGEVTFDEPNRPASTYYKVLVISKDGDGADTIYLAKFLPRASVTDVAEQSWNEDDEVRYGVTLTAYNDATVGTAVRHFYGGPGWTALDDAHGFGGA